MPLGLVRVSDGDILPLWCNPERVNHLADQVAVNCPQTDVVVQVLLEGQVLEKHITILTRVDRGTTANLPLEKTGDVEGSASAQQRIENGGFTIGSLRNDSELAASLDLCRQVMDEDLLWLVALDTAAATALGQSQLLDLVGKLFDGSLILHAKAYCELSVPVDDLCALRRFPVLLGLFLGNLVGESLLILLFRDLPEASGRVPAAHARQSPLQ